jgi:hypothetical protein
MPSSPPDLLYHLVYQSTATTPLSDDDLEALLKQSRAWNTAHGLTGVLLYCHGEIMQVLEGTEQEVHYIFRRIERDYRHRSVTRLSDGPIAQRNFSQWSMGFKAVEPQDFRHLAGYLNPGHPEELHLAGPDSPSLHALLASFVGEDVIRY